MNVNDILEIEQKKYCYEQAYAMHRQGDIPRLFAHTEEDVFSIPSANDYVQGWDKINEKFTGELMEVSPREDSFHTGWQICTPFIWENKEEKKVYGAFPTTGFFVMNLIPDVFKPPYNIMATMEFWNDQWVHTTEGWKIKELRAQFMLGHMVWKWDAARDDTFATRCELRSIKHPVWGKEDA